MPGGEAIAKETGCDFFSVPIELGVRVKPAGTCPLSSTPHLPALLTRAQPNGAEKAINPLDGISEKEKALLSKAIDGLKGNITKGVNFAHNPPQK